MGIVMVNAAISLDGFIAGPNHEMDWVFDPRLRPGGQGQPGQADETVEEIIQATGAILAGRGSYDVGKSSQREETQSAFGGRWSGPEFVLTHRPPAGEDGHVTFLSGDIRDAVATALKAAGERNLLVLGATVARECLAADLVGELVLQVIPVLLGAGISLFGAPGGPQADFDTVGVRQSGQVVNLRFRRHR